MNPVGREAVEGARLHGNAFGVAVGLLREVERLQHPESWKTPTSRHHPKLIPLINWGGGLSTHLVR